METCINSHFLELPFTIYAEFGWKFGQCLTIGTVFDIMFIYYYCT